MTKPKPELSVAIQTLVTGGFVLERATRHPGYALIYAKRSDEFDGAINYCFAIADGGGLDDSETAAIQIAATNFEARLVLIGDQTGETPAVAWDRFLGIFGGPIYSTSPLEPEFAGQLITLGKNELPEGLVGRADDLFEAYSRTALEFICGVRVIRYGQERRFEARPDGIVLPKQQFSALYDAKAASGGFDMTATASRQFQSYIEDFQSRYSDYLPRINAFLVISTNFLQQDEALIARSRDLFASCGVPISFLRTGVLAEVIQVLAMYPTARRSVNWSRVFSEPVVISAHVERELKAIIKDGIIMQGN